MTQRKPGVSSMASAVGHCSVAHVHSQRQCCGLSEDRHILLNYYFSVVHFYEQVSCTAIRFSRVCMWCDRLRVMLCLSYRCEHIARYVDRTDKAEQTHRAYCNAEKPTQICTPVWVLDELLQSDSFMASCFLSFITFGLHITNACILADNYLFNVYRQKFNENYNAHAGIVSKRLYAAIR